MIKSFRVSAFQRFRWKTVVFVYLLLFFVELRVITFFFEPAEGKVKT